MDEDCLNLNIFIPSRFMIHNEDETIGLSPDINQANLPVMVYIFGGAFTSGSNNVPLYDGRFMAEQGDVIVVEPNYR